MDTRFHPAWTKYCLHVRLLRAIEEGLAHNVPDNVMTAEYLRCHLATYLYRFTSNTE